jgi:hypothetical protein
MRKVVIEVEISSFAIQQINRTEALFLKLFLFLVFHVI